VCISIQKSRKNTTEQHYKLLFVDIIVSKIFTVDEHEYFMQQNSGKDLKSNLLVSDDWTYKKK